MNRYDSGSFPPVHGVSSCASSGEPPRVRHWEVCTTRCTLLLCLVMFHLRLACLFPFLGKICIYAVLHNIIFCISIYSNTFQHISDAFEFDRHQARHGHNMLTFHYIPFHDMIQHSINITQKTTPVWDVVYFPVCQLSRDPNSLANLDQEFVEFCGVSEGPARRATQTFTMGEHVNVPDICNECIMIRCDL